MSLKKVIVAVFIFFLIIILGGGIYSKLEGWSFTDAVYFSSVTITTLGYGDLVPQTLYGKMFTIIYSISGIAIALYILTMLGKSLFTIELHKAKKILTLRKGKKFNVEKISIGMIASWNPKKGEVREGIINEIGLDYIKLQVEKKNGRLVPKKNQKIIAITSNGIEKKS